MGSNDDAPPGVQVAGLLDGDAVASGSSKSTVGLGVTLMSVTPTRDGMAVGTDENVTPARDGVAVGTDENMPPRDAST